MTQGRVVAWHHDVVPDYLRTKLNPEIETEETYIEKERDSKGLPNIQIQEIFFPKIQNDDIFIY